jgi:hypothetical protein
MNRKEIFMKNRMFNLSLMIITVAMYCSIIYSQEQDKIMRMLDSPKYTDRSEAIMIIHQDNLTQYSTAVEERIFLQNEPDLIYSFLQTLEDLNSPNIYSIAQRFLDTIDYYPNVNKEIGDLLEAKVTATGILIKFNDYSSINYVWELIDRDKPQNKFKPVLLGVLGNLLYVPQYENRARDEFLDYFNSNYYKSLEDGLYNFRPIILGILTKRYGLEIKDLLIESFLYDPAGSIQAASLQYLLGLNYTGIDSLLINRLYINESDSTIRPMVALTIATRLNTPERYYILKNYRPPIQNEHRAQGIATYIEGAKPKQPITENLIQHIDTTDTFSDALFNYSWLGDIIFANELKSVLTTAKTNLLSGDSLACRAQVKSFQDLVDGVYKDSLNPDPRFVTIEGWKFLYWNAQYILDRLPESPIETEISTYSLFASHSLWLEQNSEVLSGNIGVNDAGSPPFLDSQVELSIGIGTTTSVNNTIKANRVKVKQSSAVNGNVYYNELENNGTITGTLNTPLVLPIVPSLPEFRTASIGTQNINVPQNEEYTLQPGSYNDIEVKKNGKLIFTGGEYHINNITLGDNNQAVFQSSSEVRIAGKFDSGQGSYVGAQDTTTLGSANIVFYVGGINGSNGNLGATPKAAKIGISNTVKANFYVPNGTLWIRQNSEVEGAFIGKDLDVGIGVKVKLNSAF